MELHAGKHDLLDQTPALRAVNVRLSFVRRFGRVAA